MNGLGGRQTAFSSKVCEQLLHYVYLYVDPRDDRVLYVGKGKASRCFAHASAAGNSKKTRMIAELRRAGIEPRIDLLKYGLSENEALLVEATTIDLLGIDSLGNEVRGYGARRGARGIAGDIAAMLEAKPAKISDSAILIKVRRMFRAGIDTHQLYDATRSAWKLGPRRERAKFAMAVYGGIVREVFEIAGWVPGGTTMHVTDLEGRTRPRTGRWEFVGQVAPEAVRRKYYMRSVAGYFKPGAQNPIQYVNC